MTSATATPQLETAHVLFIDIVGYSAEPLESRRRLLMGKMGMGIAGVEAQADLDEGIYGDHLRRILALLARDTALCEVARGVLRGEGCPTPESFYRLRSAGVMAGPRPETCGPAARYTRATSHAICWMRNRSTVETSVDERFCFCGRIP